MSASPGLPLSESGNDNVRWSEIRYVVEPLAYPVRQWGAHIEVHRAGPRGGTHRWQKIGPRVVADTPTKAFEDLRTALATDNLPDVRIVGGADHA